MTRCQGEYSMEQYRLCRHFISLLFLEQHLWILYCVCAVGLRRCWCAPTFNKSCAESTLYKVFWRENGRWENGERQVEKTLESKQARRETTPSKSPPMNTRRNYFRYGVTPFLVQHETKLKEKRKILKLPKRLAVMEQTTHVHNMQQPRGECIKN